MKKKLTFALAATALVLCSLQKINAQQWKLAGNNDATASSKLGTLESVPLRLFTKNKERMRIEPNGNVGIGTSAPAAKLHLSHNSLINAPQLLLSENENDYARLNFSNTSTANYFTIAGLPAAVSTAAKLNFYYSTAGNIITLQGNGNVGIGNGAPNARLDIAGGHWDVSSTEGDVRIGNAAYRLKIGVATGGGGAGDARIRAIGGTNRIMIGINDALTINGSGNVGVGTTNPTRKLDVQNGDIRISASSSSPSYLEFLRTGSASDQVDYRFENESSLSRLFLSRSNNDFAGFEDIAWFNPSGSPFVFEIEGSARANGGVWQDSDQKLKRDITDVSSAMQIIKQLKPKTYRFKTDEYAQLSLPVSKQYGFVAQELEKVLPELVQTSPQPVRVNANGKREMEDIKSVNYTELIPILTKAIQEQQAQIEELKQTVSKLSGETVTGITERSQKIGFAAGALLDQNIPNPFNNSTTINFTLPQKYSTAKIVIADRAGKVIKDVKVSGNGKNSLTLNSSSLTSGTYSYSLYVDSKLISTRQMMLTR